MRSIFAVRIGEDGASVYPNSRFHWIGQVASWLTRRTVSKETLITWPISRTMDWGSAISDLGRLGSLVMLLRLSVETWYWAALQLRDSSMALRLPDLHS